MLNKIKQIYFESETCNENNVHDPAFKEGRNLANYNCIDFKKYNLTMGGFWDGEFVIKIEIKIFHCDQNDRKKKCSSLQDLKKYLIQDDKLYFSIFYPEFFFEPNNLIDPLRYQYVNYYNQMSVNLWKKDRIFFKEVNLNDDQNLLLTEIKQDKIHAADKIGQDYVLKFDGDFTDKVTSEVYSMVIYLSKGGDKFTRRFMKLQDLAATVGGFMQIVFIIGKILCAYFNKYERNISLFNQLFDFKEEHERRESIDVFKQTNPIPMVSNVSEIRKFLFNIN